MYAWLRNTHLLLGLFCCLFLVMYGVSSVQMSHHWFDVEPVITESRLALAPGLASNPRDLAHRLIGEHGWRGELTQIRKTATGCTFRVVRLGGFHEVDYADQTGQATIRSARSSLVAMQVRLHGLAGMWRNSPLVDAWGGLVGVVSAALILLGLTGIYLWFKIHKERVAGTILLVISLGYSLTLMIVMRLAAN